MITTFTCPFPYGKLFWILISMHNIHFRNVRNRIMKEMKHENMWNWANHLLYWSHGLLSSELARFYYEMLANILTLWLVMRLILHTFLPSFVPFSPWNPIYKCKKQSVKSRLDSDGFICNFAIPDKPISFQK